MHNAIAQHLLTDAQSLSPSSSSPSLFLLFFFVVVVKHDTTLCGTSLWLRDIPGSAPGRVPSQLLAYPQVPLWQSSTRS